MLARVHRHRKPAPARRLPSWRLRWWPRSPRRPRAPRLAAFAGRSRWRRSQADAASDPAGARPVVHPRPGRLGGHGQRLCRQLQPRRWTPSASSAPGSPSTGSSDLVMLRPLACPPDPAHYGESILGGRLPSVLGDHGSLGLSRFGLQGGFTGAPRGDARGPLRPPLVPRHAHLAHASSRAADRRQRDLDGALRRRRALHLPRPWPAGGWPPRSGCPARSPRATGCRGRWTCSSGRGGLGDHRVGVSLTLRFANGQRHRDALGARVHGTAARVTASHSGG